MNKIKVLSVFGTRPEAIKMAPLIKELEKEELIESYVCVTAQHREMLDQVLDIFNIKPDFDLDIMQQRQTLATVTTRAIEGLDNVIKEIKPNIVLVHGDTTTTFAGAVASFYNKVSVGHVEAGLRTDDKYSPFPEEMNRKLTGNITEIHFAPTIRNKENLLKEGIKEEIYLTGNTVIDALNHTVRKDYQFKNEQLQDIDFSSGRHILMTAHRRENLGEPLENICKAVRKLVEEFEDINVTYPVHLNPAVRETVNNILGDVERVNLIEPVDVEDMHNLMDRSYMIMTDSGGLQEEAPSLGKPVLVLRTETERPEAVKAGTVKIAGVTEAEVYNKGIELLTNIVSYNIMAKAANPYGDGQASKRIVQAILNKFGLEKEERLAYLDTSVG
ncbi:UDP-N-acetylglucosamine 2-epimerase (non-hydrolyzing) [Proteinivorax hydrogeniformans]|uniref:UDP-N-acetylglucosamine 2-epimerase (non-hydrolyzing) n=1 Tax=Proteinivorax hydrogeniformans TaxID=1826727 RepID=A0AAU8HWZ7_9FIRM